VAIGRKAVLQDGISSAGMEVTKRGITVDDYQRTTLPGVWAIGDATGRSILAHVGIQQGIICAENMMAANEKDYRKMDYDVVPAVIYSIPEIVGVGTVPQDLSDVKVVKVPFSTNLRAGIEYYTDGFIKLWIRDEKLVAAQAIGHMVSEIFQEAANMVALGTNINDVAEIIHAHPTYAEIIRSALEQAMDKAVDFYL
jgi:dihydrolipoamide dehydrogenase